MSSTNEAARQAEPHGRELVLVLDSGGTKTAAWLVEPSGSGYHVLGRGLSSGGNPTSVGFGEATGAITAAIDQARQEAGLSGEPVSRAVLSVAGALDPELRGKFTDWARETRLAGEFSFVPDFLPVLAAGTRDCVGVALICGTGSSAFARSAEGRTSLCGGWGYLLGDEGSGYAIGRAALRAALDDEEHRETRRPLADDVLGHFGARSAREAAKVVYRSENPRKSLAALAPLVTQAAENGNELGAAIIDSAAQELAKLVSRAAGVVGLDKSKFGLAIAGGVLVGSQRLRLQLERALADIELQCAIEVVDLPIVGCVQLAELRAAEIEALWK